MYRYKKKLKKKKKKKILPYVLFSLIFIVILMSILYFLLFSSVFFIKEVVVDEYNENIYNFSNNYIEKNILGFKTKTVFLFKRNNLRKQLLKEFLYLEDVNLNLKLFPFLLNLKLIKRESISTICDNNNCYNIDKNGIIFSYSDDIIEKNIYFNDREIKIGEEIINENLLYLITKIKDFFNFKKVIIVDDKRVDIEIENNIHIYLSLENNINDQVENFNIIMEKHILNNKNLEYIDLRFKDRVYYKYNDDK